MEVLDLLRWLHVIGAAVLLGSGAAIAFFMLWGHLSRDPALISHTAGGVVVADWLFTATAAVAQPVTGYFLAVEIGWPIGTPWLALSLALYVFTGLCWLPVVWIQHRLRDQARAAAAAGGPLPPAYFRLFRIWVALGFPAFFAVLTILWLMLSRPIW